MVDAELWFAAGSSAAGRGGRVCRGQELPPLPRSLAPDWGGPVRDAQLYHGAAASACDPAASKPELPQHFPNWLWQHPDHAPRKGLVHPAIAVPPEVLGPFRAIDLRREVGDGGG
jgi:hypothetical protein